MNLTNTASVAQAARKPIAATPVAVDTPQDNPQPATPPTMTAVTPFILEDGTPIKLVLSKNLSSSSAVQGQTVSFETVEDIVVDRVVVIPRMSAAWATVTQAQAKRRMGRGGKLAMNIDKVRLADGEGYAPSRERR